MQQKNETKSAFVQSYDIIADGFNDTYMATKKPTVSLTATLFRAYFAKANIEFGHLFDIYACMTDLPNEIHSFTKSRILTNRNSMKS